MPATGSPQPCPAPVKPHPAPARAPTPHFHLPPSATLTVAVCVFECLPKIFRCLSLHDLPLPVHKHLVYVTKEAAFSPRSLRRGRTVEHRTRKGGNVCSLCVMLENIEERWSCTKRYRRFAIESAPSISVRSECGRQTHLDFLLNLVDNGVRRHGASLRSDDLGERLD